MASNPVRWKPFLDELFTLSLDEATVARMMYT